MDEAETSLFGKAGGKGGSRPLSEFCCGESARIAAIDEPDAVRHHLGSLGLMVGAAVRIAGDAGGGKIIGIHESRLAIAGDLARSIKAVRLEA